MKLAIVVGLCSLLFLSLSPSSAENNSTSSLTFKHILVFVLENQDFWLCNLNPHLQQLAKKGTLLTSYYAITHPSQPNYIAMIAGDTMGVNSNGDVSVSGKSLVELMEGKGVSWKGYMEGYPKEGECFDGAENGEYRRKHNPFISLDSVRNNATLCGKVVNSDELWNDLIQESLPDFIFYTPDLQNDGHDTGLIYGANWAYTFVNNLLDYQVIREQTLIVLTYDEGLTGGENKVFTLLIGPKVPTGRMDNTRYTHYSLLRTIENNYELGTLGRNDDSANVFQYADNPPDFILTMGGLIGISIAGSAVLVSLVIVSVILVRKAWRRRKANKYGLLPGVL